MAVGAAHERLAGQDLRRLEPRRRDLPVQREQARARAAERVVRLEREREGLRGTRRRRGREVRVPPERAVRRDRVPAARAASGVRAAHLRVAGADDRDQGRRGRRVSERPVVRRLDARRRAHAVVVGRAARVEIEVEIPAESRQGPARRRRAGWTE